MAINLNFHTKKVHSSSSNIDSYPLLASLAPGEPKKKVTNVKMKFQIHTNYYYYYYGDWRLPFPWTFTMN